MDISARSVRELQTNWNQTLLRIGNQILIQWPGGHVQHKWDVDSPPQNDGINRSEDFIKSSGQCQQIVEIYKSLHFVPRNEGFRFSTDWEYLFETDKNRSADSKKYD